MSVPLADGAVVLYVDPDPTAAARVSETLEAAGATVRPFEDGGNATAALEAVAPDYVVSEHDPPACDVRRLLEAADAAGIDAPVVAFTDGDGDGLRGDMLDEGGYFVPKHDDGADRLRRRLSGIAHDEPAIGISQSVQTRAMDEAPVGITVADATVDDEPLVYVNDAFERLTGFTAEEALGRNCRFLQTGETDPESVAALREAVEEGTYASVELRNRHRDGEPFWNRVDIAPVRDETGEVTHFVGFQTDVTRRRRAEDAARRWAEECRSERHAAEHVLDRVEGVVSDVTSVLVESKSRRELEHRVCERVAATDGYAGAWLGEVDLPREVALLRARSGDLPAELGAGDLSIEDGIVARAIETGEVVTADDAGPLRDGDAVAGDGGTVAGDGADTGLDGETAGGTGGIDAPAADDGAGSGAPVAAIPIRYRETVYSVLLVVGETADTFGDHDVAVLSAVGRTVGTAINAIESRRMTTTDGVVTVEVSVSGATRPLAELARTAECRVEFEGLNRHEDGTLLLFLRSEAAIDEATLAAAIEASAAQSGTVVGSGDGGSLLEVTLPTTSPLAHIIDLGVRLTDLTVDPGRSVMEFETPGEPAARSLVEILEERYVGVDLQTLRRDDTPEREHVSFGHSVRESLTDRQLTALESAYRAGFFEWPHETSGDELAEAMGVSRSTFHQHLRAAQRKLLDAFFDD